MAGIICEYKNKTLYYLVRNLVLNLLEGLGGGGGEKTLSFQEISEP